MTTYNFEELAARPGCPQSLTVAEEAYYYYELNRRAFEEKARFEEVIPAPAELSAGMRYSFQAIEITKCSAKLAALYADEPYVFKIWGCLSEEDFDGVREAQPFAQPIYAVRHAEGTEIDFSTYSNCEYGFTRQVKLVKEGVDFVFATWSEDFPNGRGGYETSTYTVVEML